MRFPCPRCQSQLTLTAVGDVDVDHCYGCGGTLLEQGNTAQTLGVHALPSTWIDSGASTPHGPTAMRCPRDGGVFHEWLVRDSDQNVVVDVCDACHALWLDRDECVPFRDIVLRAGQNREHFTHGKEQNAGSFKGYVFRLLTGLPTEVWNPVHRQPVLNFILLATLMLLYTAQVVATVAVDGDPTAFGDWRPFAGFWLVPDEIWHVRNLQTLLTYAFLHGSVPHIASNLYFLWLFGNNVEDYLGRRRYLLLFCCAALAGGVAHVLHPVDASLPLVGASGGIAGIMGAYLVFFRGVRLRVVWIFVPLRLPLYLFMVVWVLSQGLLALNEKTTISWQGHLGGFAVGILLALAWRRAPVTALRELP